MLATERPPVYARLYPNCEELSTDLADGVSRVELSDDITLVGGIDPDLRCYDADGALVRIIEVVVTNPPEDSKRKKLETLKKRGVDVVEITVKSEHDLLNIFRRKAPIDFAHAVKVKGATSRQFRSEQQQYNRLVKDLTIALKRCEPAYRREFLNTIRQIKELESLYPLDYDNPLNEKLGVEPPFIRANPDKGIMNDIRYHDFWPA